MVVLVIPDGAAQPPRDHAPTALEAAHTPVLDALAREGAVIRVATTPPRLPAGSETGIPALLGAPPTEAVGRGWVDAAGYGIDVPDGLTPWRADLVYRSGKRASIRQARDACAHLGRRAHAIGGHRLLLVAAERPADRRLLGLHVRVWPGGPPVVGTVPVPTTVVCAPGAAAGCGRLLGAEVVVAGDELLAAALTADTERVVVHVGTPDEAAHRRDQAGVIAALEQLDAELLAPLRDAVHDTGGRLVVCPDHGTDPATGRHTAAPVPAVVWGPGIEARGPSVLSERLQAPLVGPCALLPVLEEAA